MAKTKVSEVKYYIKTFAENNAQVPILLVGDMGIGKSQVVQQVAKDLGYEYVDLRAATQDPGDLIGIPTKIEEKDESGKTILKTMWARPVWMPPANVKLILVLEEINRAPIDVRQALFQVVTEYKIHTHELPKHTQIIACINPSDSIYQVEDLDPAFYTRFFNVEMTADVDEWLQYMHSISGHPVVIQFINVHNDLLCKPTDKGACPIPRTWDKLSRALTYVTDDKKIFDLAVGLVGNEAAVAFRKFCDKAYKKPVTGAEILEDFKKVKVRLEEQRQDQTYNTVQDITALIGSGKAKLKKKEFDNLVDFLLTIKAEWKVQIIQKLPTNMLTELSNEPALIEAVASILNQTNKQIQQ